MSRPGSFAWIAALLLAAALFSLAVALHDVKPSAGREVATPSNRSAGEVPAAAGAGGIDRNLQSRLETLGEGLAAARGQAAARSGSIASFLPLVLAALSGFGGGLWFGRALARRRAALGPAPAPVSLGAQAAAAEEPVADGEEGAEPEGNDEVLFSRFEPHAVDLRHRGGLLPWSREARPSPGTDSLVEERLRALERTMLRLEQKLDELVDPQPLVATESNEPRLAGFAHRLVALEREPAGRTTSAPEPMDHPTAESEVGESRESELAGSPDAKRLRRAVRLLSDDGWTEERIADRLRLEPEDVLCALPGSRRRRAS